MTSQPIPGQTATINHNASPHQQSLPQTSSFQASYQPHPSAAMSNPLMQNPIMSNPPYMIVPNMFGSSFGHVQQQSPSEFQFINYAFIAIILSLIVATSLYSINPPLVQKPATSPQDSLIEHQPHLPTLLAISVGTLLVLLILPAFIT